MKITRLIPIAIYTIVFMIVGTLIYHELFGSSGGTGREMNYGNLRINYSINKRRILGPKVERLIVTPVMPKNQTYRGDTNQWTFAFESGKEFSFSPDSKNLIWVDPASGPKKVTSDLTGDLIQRIDKTQPGANSKSFSSGQEFLAWVVEPNAEQGADGKPPEAPQSPR